MYLKSTPDLTSFKLQLRPPFLEVQFELLIPLASALLCTDHRQHLHRVKQLSNTSEKKYPSFFLHINSMIPLQCSACWCLFFQDILWRNSSSLGIYHSHSSALRTWFWMNISRSLFVPRSIHCFCLKQGLYSPWHSSNANLTIEDDCATTTTTKNLFLRVRVSESNKW